MAQTTSGNSSTGQTLYATTYNCDNCHGATPGSSKAPIRNAANAGGIINLAMSNGMGGYSASSLTSTQENDIAAYIASAAVPDPNPVAKAITHNSAGTLFTMPNIYLNSLYGTFTQILTVSAPSKGSVSYSGTSATYTPNTGACGTDSRQRPLAGSQAIRLSMAAARRWCAA